MQGSILSKVGLIVANFWQRVILVGIWSGKRLNFGRSQKKGVDELADKLNLFIEAS